MLRLTRCSQPSKAGQYFRQHLQTGDSTDAPIRPRLSLQPRWFGAGSLAVGLDELTPPTAQHLTRLGNGLHPSKRVRLAPKIHRKRAYYDLTIAPPKTISLAALLRPDHPTARAILHTHIAAVGKLALELASCIRRQTPGSPPVPGWIGVTFHHTHTREGDPHLHSHLIIPNLARTAQGEWRAIQVKINGPTRQRLELFYGHELARRLRLAGLGHEIEMRSNGLPELRSLLGLRGIFSKASHAVRTASEAAGVRVRLAPGAPVNGVFARPGHSGLPIHPDRSAIRMRARLADTIRKPKAKVSDDPALLRDEADRWTRELSNIQMRAYLAFLDENDAAAERRRIGQGRPGPGTLILSESLPALRDLILQARRNHLDHLGINTPAVVFRAVMQDAAGRYEWQDIRKAVGVHVVEHRQRIKQIRRQVEEDSIRIEAERIKSANLAAQGIVIVPLPADPRAIQAANDIFDEALRIRKARAAAAAVPAESAVPTGAEDTPPPGEEQAGPTLDQGGSGRRRRR